jgi:hypothetical protein
MNARDIRIRGVGAVSAAGWNAEALYKAVRAGTPLPATDCKRPGDERTWPCETRRAPAAPPEKITRHPRLRRSSAITRYSVTAALEALADAGHNPAAPPGGIGILFVMMNGCVNYTGRFYHEVLQNPAQASPLIFPETVFNAPASHIASFLGIDGAVSTLVGSPNSIMEALDTAAFWISSGIVEECLLIAAEECDWLSAEALTYYHPKLIATEGAGALLLSAKSTGPQVREVIGPLCYTSRGANVAHCSPNSRRKPGRNSAGRPSSSTTAPGSPNSIVRKLRRGPEALGMPCSVRNWCWARAWAPAPPCSSCSERSQPAKHNNPSSFPCPAPTPPPMHA